MAKKKNPAWLASAVGEKVAESVVGMFGKKKRKRKNPNYSVEEMSETWHGRKPKSEIEIEEIETFDEDVAELADLEELGVLSSNLKDEYTIVFKKDRPKLACDADGRNLEIIGGDQRLDKTVGGSDHNGKRLIPLGWLVRIVYETDKHHLEGSNGYPESYEHYFGEEFYKDHLDFESFETPDDWWEELKEVGAVKKAISKQVIPMLVYNATDAKLMVVGGVYQVLDVGIKN